MREVIDLIEKAEKVSSFHSFSVERGKIKARIVLKYYPRATIGYVREISLEVRKRTLTVEYIVLSFSFRDRMYLIGTLEADGIEFAIPPENEFFPEQKVSIVKRKFRKEEFLNSEDFLFFKKAIHSLLKISVLSSEDRR